MYKYGIFEFNMCVSESTHPKKISYFRGAFSNPSLKKTFWTCPLSEGGGGRPPPAKKVDFFQTKCKKYESCPKNPFFIKTISSPLSGWIKVLKKYLKKGRKRGMEVRA